MVANAAISPYRTTARVVGAVYLAGFVVGIVGIMLIQSVLGAPDYLSTVTANSMMLGFAAVLWLLATRSFLLGWCRPSWAPVWVIFPRTQVA